MTRPFAALVCILLSFSPLSPAAELPQSANRPVSFAREIAPLLQKSCVQCHAKGKDKGGFSIETREAFLKGGDTGPAAEPGKSEASYAVELVAGLEPDAIMPKKGSRWTQEQVGVFRAWIDQGMSWDAGFSFAKPEPLNLHPPAVALVGGVGENALDELLQRYAAGRESTIPTPINDARFARRAYLDLIGVLPTPEQLLRFIAEESSAKRVTLVRSLLGDSRGYTEHWLTFWNDLLRNDYKGTGFIDGGRRQISGWLYNALMANMPYDQLVRELVNPTAETEGFASGILWRGTVNASMTPPMQAAQNVSQVFMGVNLKCAACHDSFINDWSLADAYGMAAVYSDDPLELVHCDKPTGEQAKLRFLYPELGALDSAAGKPQRLRQFADILTGEKNGRLARTIVNRVWARLLGRGLVEPVDDMEQAAWSPEILDWLAHDLVEHGYDLKRTIEMIVTSRAYQLPTVEAGPGRDYQFRGPLARRLTAEQFNDAVSSLSGNWARLPSSLEFDLTAGGRLGELALPDWIWTTEPLVLVTQRRLVKRSQAQAADANAKIVKARQLLDQGKPAQEAAAAAAAAAEEAAKTLRTVAGLREGDDRHRVIFRKRLRLDATPSRAYATVLASQTFDLLVNGELMKPVMTDGARNGRVRLFDLVPRLKQGENVIVISVDSHTEKAMNVPERQQFPASTRHLNAVSGMAFYVRYVANGVSGELRSDPEWHVQREPDGDWGGTGLDERQWRRAVRLPDGVSPVDEGPGLAPIRRKDFANQPVELGASLRPAVSIAALADGVRASLLAADPLALALDRPNREQVATTRLSIATTLQALELTNGATLNDDLAAAAARILPEVLRDRERWVDRFYQHALSRAPSPAARALTLELLGESPSKEQVADTLWAVLMLPEFQILQ